MIVGTPPRALAICWPRLGTPRHGEAAKRAHSSIFTRPKSEAPPRPSARKINASPSASPAALLGERCRYVWKVRHDDGVRMLKRDLCHRRFQPRRAYSAAIRLHALATITELSQIHRLRCTIRWRCARADAERRPGLFRTAVLNRHPGAIEPK